MNSVCRVCDMTFVVPFTLKEDDHANCVCGALYIAKRVPCFVDGCNCNGHLIMLGSWEKTYQRTRKAKAADLDKFNRLWNESERKYALGEHRWAHNDEFRVTVEAEPFPF